MCTFTLAFTLCIYTLYLHLHFAFTLYTYSVKAYITVNTCIYTVNASVNAQNSWFQPRNIINLDNSEENTLIAIRYCQEKTKKLYLNLPKIDESVCGELSQLMNGLERTQWIHMINGLKRMQWSWKMSIGKWSWKNPMVNCLERCQLTMVLKEFTR